MAAREPSAVARQRSSLAQVPRAPAPRPFTSVQNNVAVAVMDVMHACRCRCCLLCPPDKDLTTPYTHLGQTEIYADMIKECFDINLVVGGAGSCGICSACVGRLRDASDFKLQVQRSQAELQARLQGASVKEEESAVKPENPEIQKEDGTSEPVSENMLRLNMAVGDGASDEDDPIVLVALDDMLRLNKAARDGTSDEDVPLSGEYLLHLLASN
ncbi:uncharacterized protein LOC134751295 [Cydia strobilella]|uniref:uncharacterized protein LOC134751295 n=1 Tax=Cydia strobilella TaxID=1100964 RepID=UPI003004FBC6